MREAICGVREQCALRRVRLPSSDPTLPSMRIFASAFLIFALTSLVPAQRVSAGPDPDRTATTIAISSEERTLLAAASISYGKATWREEFEGQLQSVKGSNYCQLGKGWWTTFDTVTTVEIGGVKVEAGSYYLGVRFAEDGAISLLVFDARQAMKHGLLPRATALYTGEKKAVVVVPMTFARSTDKSVSAKLGIELTADEKDPSKGKLVMRWGPFEASAALAFHFVGAKGEGEAKK